MQEMSNTQTRLSKQANAVQKMSIVQNGGTTYIFYRGYTAGKIFVASNPGGEWREDEVHYTMEGYFRIAGEIVAAHKDLLYYQAQGNGTPILGVLIRNSGNRWTHSTLWTADGCAGDINVASNGKVFYRGHDNNVYVYNPNTGQTSQVTSNGEAVGGLKVHSSGMLLFFRDASNRLRGSFLTTSFPVSAGILVSNTALTDWTVLDENRSRLYFIGRDKNVYYYDYGCIFNCTSGAKRLGCGSKESTNNASACSASPNALSHLTLSRDGKMLFYQSNDAGLWYYFNDRENTAAAFENWNKGKISGPTSTWGPMVVDRNTGYIHHVDFYSGKLRKITYTSADNPILDCWVDSRTIGPIYKNTDPESVVALRGTALLPEDYVGLSVYPNPSDGRFTFAVTGAPAEAQLHLSITDITGKACYQLNGWTSNSEGYTLLWDAGTQPQGCYFYHILIDGRRHLSGKLVKL